MDKKKLIKYLGNYNFSEKIITALNEIPRENFVPENLKDYAYEDMALQIGKDSTISQPYTICFMLNLLELKNNQTILEIGSGSGYVLALIHSICKTSKIFGIEIQKNIAKESMKRVKEFKNIKIFNQDGKNGLSNKSPFDRILISATCKEFPKELINQLTENGIIVFPYNNSIIKIKKENNNKLIEREYPGFIFVPLQ